MQIQADHQRAGQPFLSLAGDYQCEVHGTIAERDAPGPVADRLGDHAPACPVGGPHRGQLAGALGGPHWHRRDDRTGSAVLVRPEHQLARRAEHIDAVPASRTDRAECARPHPGERRDHERAAGEAVRVAVELLVGLPQQGAADHQDAGHADDRGPRGQQARGRRDQPDAHKAQCARPSRAPAALASGRPGRRLRGIVTGVTTWEYALLRSQYHPPDRWTCTWICPDGRQIATEEPELSVLNRAGAEGWELVERSEALGGQVTHYTLKRPRLTVDSSTAVSANEPGSASTASSPEFQQCMQQMTKLANDFRRLMAEFNEDIDQALPTPAARLAVYDRLAGKLASLADGYSIIASDYSFLAAEISQDGRARLGGIRATPRDYWDESTPYYLKSSRALAESSILAANMTLKFHDSIDRFKTLPGRLAPTVQRLQSAMAMIMATRTNFEDWLEELRDIGY